MSSPKNKLKVVSSRTEVASNTNKKAPLRLTQAQRREIAERRIIEAAIDIVAAKGLQGLTLAEAGEVAGYSRSIASHHFGKKDALLIAVCRYITQSFSDSFDGPEAETGLQRVYTMAHRYFAGVLNNSARIRALYLILTEAVHHEPLTEALSDVNKHSIRRIEFHIKRGIEAGDINPNINSKTQAILILAGLRGVMAQYLVSGNDLDLMALEKDFIASIARSLVKTK